MLMLTQSHHAFTERGLVPRLQRYEAHSLNLSESDLKMGFQPLTRGSVSKCFATELSLSPCSLASFPVFRSQTVLETAFRIGLKGFLRIRRMISLARRLNGLFPMTGI